MSIRRLIPAATAATTIAALAFSLAACKQQAPQESAPDAPQATSGAMDAKPGLALTGGLLVLPAVKGNPAAAYFTLANGSDKDVALAAVSIDGAAQAIMHETKAGAMGPLENLPVKAGETVTFAPGGKHVMAFDLADGLTAGGKAEITLIFADGDKLSAPLAIEAAGGMGHDGADHGDQH